ncbi:T9SS type A sorting domain-containing protein, partial [Candidatus Marinimicrobia bacterium]|nr:T9SS type A sorting domain-containing protein [Candidatus Neomarinimicrobiota bacterium]
YCIDGDTIAFEIPIEYESVSNDNYYSIPDNFALYQNYPNPFNPVTILRYDLPENCLVNISIYDMLGNKVNHLVNRTQNSGYKSLIWNATNTLGQPVSAGIYLYNIEAGNFRQTKKMILLK